MTTTIAPGGTTTIAQRLEGVDVARALAIVGMVTVHFGPRTPIEAVDASAWIYASFAGKASLLFGLVAGVGVTLMSRRRATRTVRARLLYRTAWLFPVGLWLQSLDHPVAVILQYYAIWFALLVPFVGRSPRTVLGWALGLVPLGSAAVLVATVQRPEWVLPMRGDSPGGVLSDVALFGYYPSVTWLPVVLFGVWIGTCDLRSTRVRVTMVASGAGALVVTTWLSRLFVTGSDVEQGTWAWVLTTEAHSQMPLWLIGSTGFAVAVLGASLTAAERWPGVLRPLGDLGRLALTVYVAHLVVFHLTDDLLVARTVDEGVAKVLTFGLVSASFSTLWLRVFRRGPLEALARAGWRGVRSLTPGRPPNAA